MYRHAGPMSPLNLYSVLLGLAAFGFTLSGGLVAARLSRSRLGAAELSAHSFVDGFAIGLGFHVATSVGIIVALAVVSHDFADGINTVTVMLNSGNPLKSCLRMLLLDAVAPVLGAATTLFITLPEQALILLLSFFTGGFLYLGAGDLLPDAHQDDSDCAYQQPPHFGRQCPPAYSTTFTNVLWNFWGDTFSNVISGPHSRNVRVKEQ